MNRNNFLWTDSHVGGQKLEGRFVGLGVGLGGRCSGFWGLSSNVACRNAILSFNRNRLPGTLIPRHSTLTSTLYKVTVHHSIWIKPPAACYSNAELVCTMMQAVWQ